MTSNPTAREKFEKIRNGSDEPSSIREFAEQRYFLISLVEAAMATMQDHGLLTAKQFGVPWTEEKSQKLLQSIWQEIDQRLAEGEK